MKTDDQLRALLAPTLRWRTRFVTVPAPVTPPLDALPATTDDAREREILATLDAESLAVYADWLEGAGHTERASWMRIYPDGDRLLRTRFGGRPAGLRGEPWPICGCGDPFVFVGQITGADADEPRWFGLLAFYYCWHCFRFDEQDFAAQPIAQSWCVRTYPTAELAAFERIALPDFDALENPSGFTEARLILEERFFDGMHEQSMPHAMAFTARLEAKDLSRLDRLAYEMTSHRAIDVGTARNAGLALGGYPRWFYSPDELPRCLTCKAPMELVLQISPYYIAASWGDSTVALFGCVQHRSVFGLRMH